MPGNPEGRFASAQIAKEGRHPLSFWKRKKETASSSGSWKNKVQGFFPLVAGMLLTLLAILLAKQRISAVEKEILGKAAPTELVVAATPIPAGAMFSLENLAKKSIPSGGKKTPEGSPAGF